MKYLFFILVISAFFIACNNKANEPEPSEPPVGQYGLAHWEATDTGRLAMMRYIGEGPATFSADSIVAYLNRQYPNIQMVFKKMSGDTVFVHIPEATYLTQQMGSSGPVIFFAEAVYDLTEIPGIFHIDFDFEEGDHASPRTMTRDSFKDQ